MVCFEISRWEADLECDGLGVFPIVFNSIEKTLNNHRSAKLRKAPKNCNEIDDAFEDPEIRTTFCHSLHKEKHNLYDKTFSSKEFGYCVYSSKKSINLISQNVPEIERFLVMDATFSISPNQMFYQVLIIYARYFEKVRDSYLFFFFFRKTSFSFELYISDLSVGLHHDDTKDAKSLRTRSSLRA